MTIQDIFKANEEARAYRHPLRAMRVTLECGHLRLLSWNVSVTGIGSYTMCVICPETPTRLVVNIEETGILSEAYFAASRDAE